MAASTRLLRGSSACSRLLPSSLRVTGAHPALSPHSSSSIRQRWQTLPVMQSQQPLQHIHAYTVVRPSALGAVCKHALLRPARCATTSATPPSSRSPAVDNVATKASPIEATSPSSSLTTPPDSLHTPVTPPLHDAAATMLPLAKPSWIDTSMPAWTRPYLHLSRADRPIGTYLLFFPCGWGVALAATPSQLPAFALIAYLYTGSLVMRGAGCTINDLWDRNYDGKVLRTMNRPLAGGQTTVARAIVWTFVQFAMGVAVVVQLDAHSLALAFCSIPLVVIYPLCKRYTSWPQLVLGLAFNWGALVGYSAGVALQSQPSVAHWALHTANWPSIVHTITVSDLFTYLTTLFSESLMYVHPSAVWLYAGGVCWTIIYDTIYAFQDVAEDRTLGLKSTALLFYDRHLLWLSGFAVAMTGCLVAAGMAANMGAIYYVLGVGGTSAHLIWQIATVDKTVRANCQRRFVSNKWVGMILVLGIALDKYFQPAEAITDRPQLTADRNSHLATLPQPLSRSA